MIEDFMSLYCGVISNLCTRNGTPNKSVGILRYHWLLRYIVYRIPLCHGGLLDLTVAHKYGLPYTWDILLLENVWVTQLVGMYNRVILLV